MAHYLFRFFQLNFNPFKFISMFLSPKPSIKFYKIIHKKSHMIDIEPFLKSVRERLCLRAMDYQAMFSNPSFTKAWDNKKFLPPNNFTIK